MRTKTLTNFKSRVLTLVLTIEALAAGQNAAQAETVTYTLSGSTEQNGNVNFTKSWNGQRKRKEKEKKCREFAEKPSNIWYVNTKCVLLQNKLQIERSNSYEGYRQKRKCDNGGKPSTYHSCKDGNRSHKSG